MNGNDGYSVASFGGNHRGITSAMPLRDACAYALKRTVDGGDHTFVIPAADFDMLDLDLASHAAVASYFDRREYGKP